MQEWEAGYQKGWNEAIKEFAEALNNKSVSLFYNIKTTLILPVEFRSFGVFRRNSRADERSERTIGGK